MSSSVAPGVDTQAGPGRLDASMGFAEAPIGRPRPAVHYSESTSFADGIINRHSTADFHTFAGLPIAGTDVFEGCCGGVVERVHVYFDTAAIGSNAALLARLTEMYGPGARYEAWEGRTGYRFTGKLIELRSIEYAGRDGFVKLVFTRVAEGDGLDNA
ncbi:hypothetical protein [Nannocystis sp.]|uniref:hypothetical protein n=1 Tax=Nannocystis sp. TaxID=1962667 RepID=UPI002424BBC5|nr:hypothetical protein [Nannocystis sp.]MBK7829178.1 hypothetical protein [Nannocystis sp.]MBK9751949.1 hypothetical protein [Nannocystis sp.]